MGSGNAIVGQSGGPTSVINATLAGVIDGAAASGSIDRLYGMPFGVEGFMAGGVVNLSAQSAATVQGLRNTPGSALGSSRHKLQDADLEPIRAGLEKHDIHTLFMIGGNDTMDTMHRIEAYCRDRGYALHGVGIPKTVDNDLFGTDHTPGYGSAARYVAMSVMQAGMLARDMKRVDQFVVFQSVGRDAGWLPAAAALAKRAEDDAPHLIYVPERAFDRERFIEDVKNCRKRYGWCSIVVGEGVMDAEGKPVTGSDTTDKFANVEFGAMGGVSVGMVLHQIVTDATDWRGEFQVTESLQMCAADRASKTDVDEAYLAGHRAVELADDGATGVMVTLERVNGAAYDCTTGTVALEVVAARTKPMDDRYINEAGNFVTDAFLDYVRPLVGELPEYVRLQP
jgi:6-phosphofructokinase 1